jgi:hypothetical protein
MEKRYLEAQELLLESYAELFSAVENLLGTEIGQSCGALKMLRQRLCASFFALKKYEQAKMAREK